MIVTEKDNDKIWVISGGAPVNLDLSTICKGTVSGTVTEYAISSLAFYLLCPHSVKLEEMVVGCRVFYHKPKAGILRRMVNKIGGRGKKRVNGNDRVTEEIMSSLRIPPPEFRDENLNAHFRKICDMLRPLDSAHKKFTSLERDKVDDVKALCEDIGKNRYQLNLQGSIQDKINFVANSISRKTEVIANKAYLLNGLFEMRGYDFRSFDRDVRYRLIRFTQDNQKKYCVLNKKYQFEFWVNDGLLVNYMHILELCVRSDPKLREALSVCIKGEAKPLKLFFASRLGHDYSEKHLPMIYRDVISAYNIKNDEKDRIASTLNQAQSIVSFNYVPLGGSGDRKLCTNISVMHDFRALEPIKNQLPQVYSEINKKAVITDVGKLYLLDSMRGYQNV